MDELHHAAQTGGGADQFVRVVGRLEFLFQIKIDALELAAFRFGTDTLLALFGIAQDDGKEFLAAAFHPRYRTFDGHRLAIGAQHFQAIRQPEGGFRRGFHKFHQSLLEGRTEETIQGAVHDRGALAPEQGLRGGIEEHDAAQAVHGDDGVQSVRDNARQPFPAGFQLCPQARQGQVGVDPSQHFLVLEGLGDVVHGA